MSDKCGLSSGCPTNQSSTNHKFRWNRRHLNPNFIITTNSSCLDPIPRFCMYVIDKKKNFVCSLSLCSFKERRSRMVWEQTGISSMNTHDRWHISVDGHEKMSCNIHIACGCSIACTEAGGQTFFWLSNRISFSKICRSITCPDSVFTHLMNSARNTR